MGERGGGGAGRGHSYTLHVSPPGRGPPRPPRTGEHQPGETLLLPAPLAAAGWCAGAAVPDPRRRSPEVGVRAGVSEYTRARAAWVTRSPRSPQTPRALATAGAQHSLAQPRHTHAYTHPARNTALSLPNAHPPVTRQTRDQPRRLCTAPPTPAPPRRHSVRQNAPHPTSQHRLHPSTLSGAPSPATSSDTRPAGRQFT